MNNNTSRKTASLLLVGAAFLCLVVIGYSQLNAISARSRHKLTLAVAQQPAFALMYVADKQGFFNKNGLDITFHTHRLGKDALNEVLAGKADLASVFDIPFIRALYGNEAVSLVTTLHNSTKNHAIVSLKKNGIAAPKDLINKKIALTRGTSTEYFLYAFLLENGLDLNQVTIVDTQPDNFIFALEDGSVQAAVLFNPYLQNFIQRHRSEDMTILSTETYSELSLLVGKTAISKIIRKL